MTEFVMVPRELVQSAICYIDSKDEREGDFIAGPLERALNAAPPVAAEPPTMSMFATKADYEAAIASAEAQPALPTQEQIDEIKRLADRYADAAIDYGAAESPEEEGKAFNTMKAARAALLAALAALPREKKCTTT